MPLDWVNYVDARPYTTEYDIYKRYWTMLYYGILNVGQNEFGPVNEIEYLYMMMTLSVSVIIQVFLFGEVFNNMAILQKSNTSIQEQLDAANGVMTAIEMNSDEQDLIRSYMFQTQALKQKQESFLEFFSLIAPSLKEKVQNSLYSEVLLENNTAIQYIMI